MRPIQSAPQSAQGPYPLLFWTSSFAPAAMSCSTTSVWLYIAAPMSAVLLPRTRLASSDGAQTLQSAQGPYPSLLWTFEVGAGVD